MVHMTLWTRNSGPLRTGCSCLSSSSVIFCVLIRMLMGSLINLLLFYNKRSLFAETEKRP